MPGVARRLTVIGAGNMGQALIRGVIAAGVYCPKDIVVADANIVGLAAFAEETGVERASNVEAAAGSEVVLIAVKPFAVEEILQEISTHVTREQVIVSVAAGVTIRQIAAKLENEVPIVRAMPNTPSLVCTGATAISRGKSTSDESVERVRSIFEAVGQVIEVSEQQMDAVTGVSGSGPAYVCVMVEALIDAGVNAGLSRADARLLAVQTVYGTAKMMLETGKHPAELKEAVTSPGGTTIAGLAALERGGFRAALLDAVDAAIRRSRELSDK